MDIKVYYRIFWFVVVILLLVGQAAPKTKKQLMDEALQEKMENYIKTMETRCEKKIKKRAAEIVDSLLLKEAQVKTVDNFERPIKPTKPQRPDLRPAKDTMPVRPLFDQ